jgi:hypothetical protein
MLPARIIEPVSVPSSKRTKKEFVLGDRSAELRQPV